MYYNSKKECINRIVSVTSTDHCDSKMVEELKEAIKYLENAIPKNAKSFYYLGLAHAGILNIDTSLYDKENTSNLEKICKDGVAHLEKAVELKPMKYRLPGTSMVYTIERLARKGGIILQLAGEPPLTMEYITGGGLKDEVDCYDIEEQNEAEDLKNAATTCLEKYGSLESQGKRIQTIADAIAMLAEVLSINPEDNAANEEMAKACDLLSEECKTRQVGKEGKASLSTNENKVAEEERNSK